MIYLIYSKIQYKISTVSISQPKKMCMNMKNKFNDKGVIKDI